MPPRPAAATFIDPSPPRRADVSSSVFISIIVLFGGWTHEPILVLRSVLASLLAANLCSAAVFERDWKTPGDGLLTYDDVNRREWLDL